MANCTKCNHKWSTRDILAVGFSKEGKACSNCKEKQYISAETQNYMALGSLSLIFLIFLPFLKVKLSDKNNNLF